MKMANMEERTRTGKRNRPAWLRRAAIILGLIGAGTGMAWSFRACVGAWQEQWSLEVAYLMFAWVIRWVIVLAACKWALVGGALLILDSLLFATFVFAERYYVGTTLLALGLFLSSSLLLLASGILFLPSWGREKE